MQLYLVVTEQCFLLFSVSFFFFAKQSRVDHYIYMPLLVLRLDCCWYLVVVFSWVFVYSGRWNVVRNPLGRLELSNFSSTSGCHALIPTSIVTIKNLTVLYHDTGLSETLIDFSRKNHILLLSITITTWLVHIVGYLPLDAQFQYFVYFILLATAVSMKQHL